MDQFPKKDLNLETGLTNEVFSFFQWNGWLFLGKVGLLAYLTCNLKLSSIALEVGDLKKKRCLTNPNMATLFRRPLKV